MEFNDFMIYCRWFEIIAKSVNEIKTINGNFQNGE